MSLQPTPTSEWVVYKEIAENIGSKKNNSARLMNWLWQVIDGISEAVTGCIGLSYDALDNVGPALDTLSALYCRIIGVDKPSHLPSISSLWILYKPEQKPAKSE